MDEWLVERVLTCVDQIPAGRVVSYGDVAAIVGCGPRRVGNVLATLGQGVTWWRVTNVAGELPESLHDGVAEEWAREGIAWKDNRRGCRIDLHRADLHRLAADYEVAVRRLSPE